MTLDTLGEEGLNGSRDEGRDDDFVPSSVEDDDGELGGVVDLIGFGETLDGLIMGLVVGHISR